MTEYTEEIVPLRFSWCIPDRVGIWAYAGNGCGIDREHVTRDEVTNLNAARWGWWSFLTDMGGAAMQAGG